MKPPLIVRPAVARLRAEVRGPKALAKVGRHRLGLDVNRCKKVCSVDPGLPNTVVKPSERNKS
jgi:hypothetical protein